MAQAAANRDGEDSLAIRAAWLHYAAGMTQAEVAARLGVPSVKAHRLITWANRNGAVKVSIEGDVAECVALEMRLAEREAPDAGLADVYARAFPAYRAARRALEPAWDELAAPRRNEQFDGPSRGPDDYRGRNGEQGWLSGTVSTSW